MGDAGRVAGLFPSQDRDWSLPAEVPLTPLAAERVAREAADRVFDDAARSLNLDWQTQLDGKQVQRWSQRMGDRLVAVRSREMALERRGVHPEGPAVAPLLLVMGMDGGRVHTRDKNPQTQSHWREDKVASFTNYIPGDGKDKKPVAQVTTYTATMKGAKEFGPMVGLEANRRGLARAAVVLNISDGGNWIDPLAKKWKLADVRIIDYYHAVEHLHLMTAAVHGKDTPETKALHAELEGLLWKGQVREMLLRVKPHLQLSASDASPASGPISIAIGILRREVRYFEKHQQYMMYDVYRGKGWPIGSGNTKAGVKTFNKRVKGTEQRWRIPGAEAILALRAAWKSQDARWERLWANRPAYILAKTRKKAA